MIDYNVWIDRQSKHVKKNYKLIEKTEEKYLIEYNTAGFRDPIRQQILKSDWDFYNEKGFSIYDCSSIWTVKGEKANNWIWEEVKIKIENDKFTVRVWKGKELEFIQIFLTNKRILIKELYYEDLSEYPKELLNLYHFIENKEIDKMNERLEYITGVKEKYWRRK
jgi:hypothetical protein